MDSVNPNPDPIVKEAPEAARSASSAKDALENFLGLGLVIVGIVLAAKYLGGDQLRLLVEGAGAWAPLALVLGKALTIVAAPLSGGPLYPLAGALFGAGPAILYLTAGDVLGGTVAFFLARRFGRALVERMLKKSAAGFLDRALHFMGTVPGFFVARVCFVALPEAVAYAAGLTRLRYLPFVSIYALVGLAPTVVLAWLGDVAFTAGSGWLLAFGLIGGTVAAGVGALLFARLTKNVRPSDSPKPDAE